MAKKPAIANVARPEGFIDDVVLPIAQKITRGYMRSGMTASGRGAKRVVRGARATSAIATKRAASYGKKAEKAYSKSNASRSAIDGSVRRAENRMVKGNVMKAKQEAARKIENVSKTAKFARATNKAAVRDARKRNVMKMKGLR